MKKYTFLMRDMNFNIYKQHNKKLITDEICRNFFQ